MNLSQHIPQLHTVGKPWSAPWSTASYLRASLQEQSKTSFAQTGEQSSAAAVGKRQRGARWQGVSRLCEASPDFTVTVGVASYTSVPAGPKKVGLVSVRICLQPLCSSTWRYLFFFIIYIKGSGCSEKWGLIGFCWHWWFQLTIHWWSCGGIRSDICEAWRRWKLRCDCVSTFILKEIVFWC